MKNTFEVPGGLSDIRVKVTAMGGSDDPHTADYYSSTLEWVGYEGRVVSIWNSGWPYSTRIDGGTRRGHRWEPIVYVPECSGMTRSYLYGEVTHGDIKALIEWLEENKRLRVTDFIHIEPDGKVWLS
jgi:hypothetical protein